MRGNFLHNQVIAAALARSARQRGAHVQIEYPIRRGQHSPAVDMLILIAGLLLAIEIENSTHRIANDLMKIESLHPDVGLIVMPNARLVRSSAAVVRRLTAVYPLATASVQVLTFGAALQWIEKTAR
jgi:hypothetical protein